MIVEIDNLQEKGVEVYSSLTEHSLQKENGEGVLIAESPKVIFVALEEGYEPISLLCERKHIEGDAADIVDKIGDQVPVYTGSREILRALTGYTLTRGVLCAMKRKIPESPMAICEGKSRICVIESVCDTTNIGSIFRSAAALGIDGILLTPDSCDPFNRRSIRVSMGTVFKVPWAFSEQPIDLLKSLGYATVALTLHKDSILISDPMLKKQERIAMLLGTEGTGLSPQIISKCDYKAIIPMFRNVDSLNVGVAAAIAFWELSTSTY